MIDAERINSQLSLSHEKAIASVDPGWRLTPPRHSVRSTGWPLVPLKLRGMVTQRLKQGDQRSNNKLKIKNKETNKKTITAFIVLSLGSDTHLCYC